MKKIYILFFCACCFLGVKVFAKEANDVTKKEVQEILSNLPLSFTENKGQFQNSSPLGNIRFKTHTAGAQIFFGEGGISFSFTKSKKIKGEYESLNYSVHFLGATSDVKLSGVDMQSCKTNYLLGNDPGKYVTGVANYDKVRYNDLYENIDLIYYGTGKKLKYDFVLRPGANVKNIRLDYTDIKNLTVNTKGQLEIQTTWGTLQEEVPYSYQIIDGKKKEVKVRYKIEENYLASLSQKIHHRNVVGFEICEEYDKNYELIIDPYTLLWSTFVGGNHPNDPPINVQDGYAYAVHVDNLGNTYATGYYQTTFPVTPNAYQLLNNGGVDVFIIKLDIGGVLQYSTYLGGKDAEVGTGISVNSSGEICVAGWTRSTDFPTKNAFQDIPGAVDCFVAKLNFLGTGLVFSTYLGGKAEEECANIGVDSDGNIYVAGTTHSVNFPIKDAFDSTYNNGGDGFITKFGSTGNLIFSTFFGGTGSDMIMDMRVNRQGEIFITGGTTSDDLPVTVGSFDRSFNGVQDVFVTKFRPDGKGLMYSTYIGSSESESANGIAVNTAGEVFITGSTAPGPHKYPTTPGSYKTSGGGVFVTKLNAAGSNMVYSTFIGPGGNPWHNIAVNENGEVFVVGKTTSKNFPVSGDAFQPINRSVDDLPDFFLSRLSAAGDALVYSTYIGGVYGDYKASVSVNMIGGVEYVTVAGTSHSPDFPITHGSKLNLTDDQPVFFRFGGYTPCSAVSPDIQKPAEVNFGTISCGDERDSSLVIKNNSCYYLRIDSLQIAGTNASNFELLAPTSFPFIIGGNAFSNISIRFKTTGLFGPKTATLKIYSNDITPLSDTLQTITLKGLVGSTSFIALTKKLDLDTLLCDDSTRDASVYIKNTGTARTKVTARIEGANAPVYRIIPDTATIRAGDSTKFTVRFRPTGNGTFTAHVIVSAPCAVDDTVYLTGTKNSNASISATPQQLIFSTLSCVAEKWRDSIVTVKNTGAVAVTIHPAQIAGQGFSLVKPTTPVTLDPDSSVEYVIRFRPTGVGDYSGTMMLTLDPCNLSTFHLLKGRKDSVKILALMKVINFDTVSCTVDDPEDTVASVWIKNTGTDTVSITHTVTIAGYTVQPASAKVAPGDSVKFKIAFHPTGSGSYNGLVIFSTAPCGVRDIVNVFGVKKGNISISSFPEKLDYMSVCGEADSIIIVKNTGQDTVYLDPALVVGNGFSLVSPVTAQTVAPGDSVVYTIRFSTSSVGNYSGNFQVTGSPCDLNTSHPLAGRKDKIITSVNPPNIDLGVVGVMTTANGSTEYKNEGVPGVRVKEAYFSPNPFSGIITTSFPKTLRTSEMLPINFTVQPPATGSYSGTIHVVVDSPCYDEKNIIVTLEAITGCAHATAIENKTPGEIAEIPIVLETTEKIKNVKKIYVEITYDRELLRAIVKEPTTNVGVIEKDYRFDLEQGTLLFTVVVNKPLDIPTSEIARFRVQALLAPRRNGEMSIKATVVGQNDNTLFSATCPTPFVLDESCVPVSSTQTKNSASILSVYPNPSKGQTLVEVGVIGEPFVTMEVYDVFGRRVEMLCSGALKNGNHEFQINTEKYSNGIYFLRLMQNSTIQSRVFNVER